MNMEQIAERLGEINAHWDSQLRWNEKVDTTLETFRVRISSIEKRIATISGAAALIGSGVGAVIAHFYNLS